MYYLIVKTSKIASLIKENYIWIIVIVALLGLTIIGAYFFYRNKK